MRKFERWIPWLLLAVGLAIRFWHYTTANISMDEPFTLFHSQKSLTELISLFEHENNPPLFFFIMHFWISLFGIEPEYVRIVPVVISAATAPAIYLFGAKHFTKTIGFAAALFFLFSNLHQYHAHDVRAYPLFTLLTIWSLHHYMNLKAGKWRDVVLLGLANSLLLYNHFFGAIVIAVQGFSIISIRSKRMLILHFIGSGLVSLAMFSAYIPIVFGRLMASTGDGVGWLRRPGVDALYNMIWSFTNRPVVAVICIALVVLIPAWLKLFRILKPSPNEKVMVLLFWMPFFGLWSLSQHQPMYLDRYIIFASIGFYFAVLFIVSRLKYSKILVTGLVFCFLLTFNPSAGHDSGIKELVTHLKEHRHEDQVILMAPEWNRLEFGYHLDHELFQDYGNLDERLNELGIYALHDADDPLLSKITFPNEAILIDGDNSNSPMTRSMIEELSARYSEHHENRQFTRYVVHRFSQKN